MSGRPIYEANVAHLNMQGKQETMKLSVLLRELAVVGKQMQRSLDTTVSQPGLASASLNELSHPSNSYFVSMRTDATSAIRTAHERLNTELAHRGHSRRISLWELVEGGCAVLTTRFAEFAGFILVQSRSSVGVSAMYTSMQMISTNAQQARVALAKLATAAAIYGARVPTPKFDTPDVQAERRRVMEQGGKIRDIDIFAGPFGRGAAQPGLGSLFAPISSSGWSVVR